MPIDIAASIDESDYEAGCTYGGQQQMKAALAKFLADKDPKDAKQRRAKSSWGRGQVGVLRQAPTLVLLKEALKREQKVRARELGRLRQQRHRAKLKRAATATVTGSNT